MGNGPPPELIGVWQLRFPGGVPESPRALEDHGISKGSMELGHQDLAGLRFVGIEALGHFWKDDNLRDLALRWDETLVGLHALGRALVFCVLNREGTGLQYLVTDWNREGAPDAALSRARGVQECVVLMLAEPCDVSASDFTLNQISDEVRLVSPWTQQSVEGTFAMTSQQQDPIVNPRKIGQEDPSPEVVQKYAENELELDARTAEGVGMEEYWRRVATRPSPSA